MKAKQLHEMTTEELTSKVAELKGELFQPSFSTRHRTASEPDEHQTDQTRYRKGTDHFA